MDMFYIMTLQHNVVILFNNNNEKKEKYLNNKFKNLVFKIFSAFNFRILNIILHKYNIFTIFNRCFRLVKEEGKIKKQINKKITFKYQRLLRHYKL